MAQSVSETTTDLSPAGVWRFSYPITITFGQVLATHVCFMIWILLTRLLHQPLAWLGLENLIAPPVRKLVSPGTLLTLGASDMSLLQALQVLPLAIVFVAKLFFGNLSFAYVFAAHFTSADELILIYHLATYPYPNTQSPNCPSFP